MYTPKLTHVFDNDIITEIVDYSKNPAEDLMHFFDKRIIFQYAGIWKASLVRKLMLNHFPMQHA